MFHKWREISIYLKENAHHLHYERKAIIDLESIKRGKRRKKEPIKEYNDGISIVDERNARSLYRFSNKTYIETHLADNPNWKSRIREYRDRCRRIKKLYCKKFRVQNLIDKLDTDLKNKKIALEAEDIQRHADRNDFRPAYKFVKNFRQGNGNQIAFF